MIYGITHDEDGDPIERVIVSHKIAVGLHPTAAGQNYPKRLDELVACTRSSDKKDKGVFVIDQQLTDELKKNYSNGGPLMEIDVVLRSEDPEKILKTEYAWRSQNYRNTLLCHGDGRNAARKWEGFSPDEKQRYGGNYDPKDVIEFDENQEFVAPCGPRCPHLRNKECKPSADLYFLLPERVTAGALATLHTGGWEATKRLASSLYQIYEEVTKHGGSLLNLRLKLVARPYRASYKDKNGKEDSSTQLAFNLEYRRSEYKNLLPEMIRESREGREAYSNFPAILDVEPLTDQEIAEEFNPTPEQQEAQRKEEERAEQRAPSTRPTALNKVLEQTKERRPTEAAPQPTPTKTYVDDEI